MLRLLPRTGGALVQAGRATLLYSMQPLYYIFVIVILAAVVGGWVLGSLWATTGALGFLVTSSIAYWLERRKHVLTGRIIFTGLMFAVITLFFVLLGTYSAIAFFYSWPLLVALLLMGPEVTLGLSLATGSLLGVIFILERFIRFYAPPVQLEPGADNIVTLLGVMVLIASGGAGYLHLSRRLLNLKVAMRHQATELSEILIQQAQTRTAYQTLGQEVAATSRQLLNTSSEQASGAAQQVSAIVQVTFSMEELSQAATQIAERGRTIQQISSEVARSALEVAATTAQVSEASKRGQVSVEDTFSSNETMQTAYQNLNNRLEHLSGRSTRIQTMLDLIESIADETHLLALNATIEAAGAGENGERFNVIAQEVKSLADRSRRTNEEVRLVVTEVDQALREAREEAAHGDAVAEKAALSAGQSAQVISELEEMVKRAAYEAFEISRNITGLEGIAREIGFATHIQQKASEEVLNSLHTVKKAAETNAVASSQLTESTSRLQNLASQFDEGVRETQITFEM